MTNKTSVALYTIGGITIVSGSFILAGLDGLSLGTALGKVTGNVLGYAAICFVFSRVEFQVNEWIRLRVMRPNNRRDDADAD